jgi:AcrR family transcriptional regulator
MNKDSAEEVAVEWPVPPGSPAWWQARSDAGRAGRRVPVTVERIVSTALALIDREGLQRLSMRNLAAELGTGTTTLYRHLASKDEVLALVADEIIGEAQIERPMSDASWRQVIEDVARSLRETLVSHPNAVPLFAVSVPVGPNALRARNLVLGLLRGHGLSPKLSADVLVAVLHHVLASALLDPMVEFRVGEPSNPPTLSLRDFYRGLAPDTYPELIELADQLTGNSPEKEFDFGLSLLLDGVELRIERSSRGID